MTADKRVYENIIVVSLPPLHISIQELYVSPNELIDPWLILLIAYWN
jgi:hypothetical protein